MNDMIWVKLGAGTMQCMPEPAWLYHILKVRSFALSPVEPVITYHVLKLTEKDWLHLGSADTFEEAKGIAAHDYSAAA